MGFNGDNSYSDNDGSIVIGGLKGPSGSKLLSGLA